MLMAYRKSTENLFVCSEKELREMIRRTTIRVSESIKTKNESFGIDIMDNNISNSEIESFQDDIIGSMMDDMTVEVQTKILK